MTSWGLEILAGTQNAKATRMKCKHILWWEVTSRLSLFNLHWRLLSKKHCAQIYDGWCRLQCVEQFMLAGSRHSLVATRWTSDGRLRALIEVPSMLCARSPVNRLNIYMLQNPDEVRSAREEWCRWSPANSTELDHGNSNCNVYVCDGFCWFRQPFTIMDCRRAFLSKVVL